MCPEGVVGYYIGISIGMLLIALWIASSFKKHKFLAFIIICIIGFISVYIHGDSISCIFLSWCILFVIIGFFVLLFKSAQFVNNNYIEPTQKKHQSNIKKYRKYVINCDKKGKQPLSYKQWKFAYGNTKK